MATTHTFKVAALALGWVKVTWLPWPMLKSFHLITARCVLWLTSKAPFEGSSTVAAPAVTCAPFGRSTAGDGVESIESPSVASTAAMRFLVVEDFPCPLESSETATQVLATWLQIMR